MFRKDNSVSIMIDNNQQLCFKSRPRKDRPWMSKYKPVFDEIDRFNMGEMGLMRIVDNWKKETLGKRAIMIDDFRCYIYTLVRLYVKGACCTKCGFNKSLLFLKRKLSMYLCEICMKQHKIKSKVGKLLWEVDFQESRFNRFDRMLGSEVKLRKISKEVPLQNDQGNIFRRVLDNIIMQSKELRKYTHYRINIPIVNRDGHIMKKSATLRSGPYALGYLDADYDEIIESGKLNTYHLFEYAYDLWHVIFTRRARLTNIYWNMFHRRRLYYHKVKSPLRELDYIMDGLITSLARQIVVGYLFDGNVKTFRQAYKKCTCYICNKLFYAGDWRYSFICYLCKKDTGFYKNRITGQINQLGLSHRDYFELHFAGNDKLLEYVESFPEEDWGNTCTLHLQDWSISTITNYTPNPRYDLPYDSLTSDYSDIGLGNPIRNSENEDQQLICYGSDLVCFMDGDDPTLY